MVANSDNEGDAPSPCERIRDNNSSIDSEEDQEIPDLMDPEDSLDSKDESIGPSHNPNQGKTHTLVHAVLALSQDKQTIKTDTELQELDNHFSMKKTWMIFWKMTWKAFQNY